MHNNRNIERNGYKPSSLGLIPENWEVKRLGEISEIGSGGTPSKKNSDYWNGNIPWITTALINHSSITYAEEYITEEGLSNSSAKILSKGVLLMAMYGQGQTRGRVARLEIDAATNQACAYIDITNGSSDFVYHYLVDSYERIRIESNDGNQKNLSLGIIGQIKIPFPPLPEQRKIAEVLSTWDKAIELQTALVDKLTLRKKGLMHQLLTGKKRLPGFSEHWRKIKLGAIGNTYSGLTGLCKEDFEHGNMKYIPYINIFQNNIVDVFALGDVNITTNQNIVLKGDIFFTTSSETPEEVGLSSVLLGNVENLYLNSFCFGYRLNDMQTLLPEYASYIFRQPIFRKEIYKLSQGSTRFNISPREVMKISIRIPQTIEQLAIVHVLMSTDKEISKAKQKLEALKWQKKGLMQQLLTGKKRVKL